MATAQEDFTFPATTTDLPPRSLDSPPLWRRSPTPAPAPSAEKLKGKEVNDQQDDQEEKMDMLWEDLNEELSRNCGDAAPDVSREVQMSCVRALKLSRKNGQMVSGKKPNIVVFIKVLQKIFFLRNSRRTIKNRSW